MTKDAWLKRRNLLRAGAGLSVGGLLQACGGGGGDSGTVPVTSGGSTVSLSNLDASTYMIGYTVNLQGGQRTFLLGTGFPIEGNLIATNAHVTAGLLTEARQLARNGIRIVKASAYQSETGREIPLLKAVIHPSYSGDTRSPDVGLFEAREQLPARLELESAQGTTRLRKGDSLQQNGFPGDLFNAVFNNFQPGLSVPKATLFTGTIQTIEHFDSRVIVDPTNLSLIDMYAAQHGHVWRHQRFTDSQQRKSDRGAQLRAQLQRRCRGAQWAKYGRAHTDGNRQLGNQRQASAQPGFFLQTGRARS